MIYTHSVTLNLFQGLFNMLNPPEAHSMTRSADVRHETVQSFGYLGYWYWGT